LLRLYYRDQIRRSKHLAFLHCGDVTLQATLSYVLASVGNFEEEEKGTVSS